MSVYELFQEFCDFEVRQVERAASAEWVDDFYEVVNASKHQAYGAAIFLQTEHPDIDFEQIVEIYDAFVEKIESFL